MIELLLLVHKFFYGNNNRYHYKNTNIFKWLVCNVMAVITSYQLYFWMTLRRVLGIKSSIKSKRNCDIVVSFTSYPARINNVWLVVDSLMRQAMPPGTIELYLSEQDFPNRENDLPQSLLDYLCDEFHIFWVKDNLMPHKKYYYAFQHFQDKIIITVDDDNYYRKDLIESLWNTYKNNPDAVCANTVTAIVDSLGVINDYGKWYLNSVEFERCSFNYLAIGASGVLYPKGEYRKKASSNINIIKDTCLRADDLWLKCQELICGIPVAVGGYYCPAVSLVGSQKTSLISYNCSDKSEGNNTQWHNLDKLYGVSDILKQQLRQENG